MKILGISDEESASLWEFYNSDKLKNYDLIISCGDLKAEYLSFLVTMSNKPVLYVRGNHDSGYLSRPPEGCDCIDDQFVTFNGVRILGLGGCLRYNDSPFHYTERQMRRRIRKLRYQLWKNKGVDIVVTHAPPRGYGDMEDWAHRGFEAFLPLLQKYKPRYLLHGHVHLSYDGLAERTHSFGDTQIVNAYERCAIDIPEGPVKGRDYGQVIYKTRRPKTPDYDCGFHGPLRPL